MYNPLFKEYNGDMDRVIVEAREQFMNDLQSLSTGKIYSGVRERWSDVMLCSIGTYRKSSTKTAVNWNNESAPYEIEHEKKYCSLVTTKNPSKLLSINEYSRLSRRENKLEKEHSSNLDDFTTTNGGLDYVKMLDTLPDTSI